MASGDNSLSKALICAAIACAVIYAPQIETAKRITPETL
jgi:hypothetical protein